MVGVDFKGVSGPKKNRRNVENTLDVWGSRSYIGALKFDELLDGQQTVFEN